MEGYKFTGVLVYVGEVQQFKSKNGNVFVKRDIALADDPQAQYPTVLVGTLKKGKSRDMTEKVSTRDVNKPCTVTFYPDGRFYNDKQTGAKRTMAGNTITFIDWSAIDKQKPDADGVPSPAEPDGTIDSADFVPDDLPF